jgi:hypothetical protein
MDKKEINREEIISEYLTDKISYRALGKKHGVLSRSICDWVMRYQGRLPGNGTLYKHRLHFLNCNLNQKSNCYALERDNDYGTEN